MAWRRPGFLVGLLSVLCVMNLDSADKAFFSLAHTLTNIGCEMSHFREWVVVVVVLFSGLLLFRLGRRSHHDFFRSHVYKIAQPDVLKFNRYAWPCT